ncbi:MAG TPA: hypothetical protein VI932_07925 [Bacteroidota bacterium]|nr:hypothetical protein [Bacteroidota bacterium]
MRFRTITDRWRSPGRWSGDEERIDFAFNFEEHRFAQVIISSDHLFRAFRRIEYVPPIDVL